MLDILSTLESWQQEQRPVALATVIETWGSSPRCAGAKMGVTATSGANAAMGMTGSVSGGCVEGAVVGEAIDGLEDRQPRLLNFGVADDVAWDVGLTCGGKISIYVEPLDRAWWEIAADHVKQDRPMVTALILSGDSAGGKVLVDDTGVVYASNLLAPAQRDDLATVAQLALIRRNPYRANVGDLDVFFDVYQPRPRLILIGGAHVAMALKNYALSLGFRVILVDPRKAFATPERFPDVELISHEYPDKALPKIGLTSESYIAVLTHDPKIDDSALKVALPSPAAYIGVLSSSRTHEKRLERLTNAGVDPVLFSRIRTPIGIDIGAQTPEEIALCIMAEIIAVRNGVGSINNGGIKRAKTSPVSSVVTP